MEVHPIKFALPQDYDERLFIKNLAEQFSIKEDTNDAGKKTFYDTFDWRLYKKSLVLTFANNRLTLQQLPEEHALQSVPNETPPKFVEDLPQGVQRKRLAPILEMRALIPQAEINFQSKQIRVLNQNEKTVAYCICEAIKSPGKNDSSPFANYLWAKPVRGYDDEFKNLADWCREQGYKAVSDNVYYQLLEANGKKPGQYSSKLNVQLNPGQRSDQAAKEILRFLLSVIKANIEGIKQDIDTEFLHDYRVAIRRTRSALSQIKNVFPQDVTDPFKDEFKMLGKATNQLRDLDVYLLNAEDYRAMLPDILKSDIDPLFVSLKQKRNAQFKKVFKLLNSSKFSTIIKDWEDFITNHTESSSPAPNAAIPIYELACRRIYKRYKRVLKSVKNISENTADAHLHKLRIDYKKLRYLMEFFSSLFPDKKIQRLIKQIKRLQDNLGTYNDLTVQIAELQELAEEFAGQNNHHNRTFLAIGSLIGRLDQQKREEKARFYDLFAEFNSKKNQKIFEQLFNTDGAKN